MKKYERLLLFLLVLGITSCATQAPISETDPGKSGEKAGIQPDYVTIVAVGDNLYHSVMIHNGEEGDYDTAYSEIRPLIEKADIAFINQETLLAGKDYGFSGYPLFNTPQKLGHAITRTGFNIVNHATNHIMDKGEKAVFATMDFWDTIPEVTVLGIHRSKDQRSMPKLLRKNGITLGFLAYTYGTNGIRVPADKPYLVSLIQTEVMEKEIDSLRPLCDFLVVSMHWGEEYQHGYNKSQETLAAFLAEHNVDLVIGHHPHVTQTIETIERPDGKTMLCFYSLGNFLSGQIPNPTLLGAMAYIKITKDNKGSYSIYDYGALPLVTHYENDFTNFRVYPLYAYTEELAEKHRQNQLKRGLSIAYSNNLAAKIFADKEIRFDPFMR